MRAQIIVTEVTRHQFFHKKADNLWAPLDVRFGIDARCLRTNGTGGGMEFRM